MKFIDFHSHIYPEAIAKKATKATLDFYNISSDYIGTPEEKIATDKKAGIYKSVILPVAVLPKHVHSINVFTSETAKKYGEFLPFGTVHAGDENILNEVELFADMGLRGIKMHPDMQKFNIDDERLFPLYDMIAGKMPVIFHSGDPRYPYSHPERIKRILDMFPDLTVVAAHFGGWSMQEVAFPLLKKYDRCFVDTCSAIMDMTDEKAVEYIKGYGVERVLFGSDYPVDCPVKQARRIMNLPISDDEKEKIAYINGERFIEEYL